MASLYAQYVNERTNDSIVESPEGFITYRYLGADQVYIVDLFVLPEFRKQGIARKLADMVCKEAKDKGCKELLGTVNPSCKGSNESILTLLAYGMSVNSSSNNVIVFKKGLSDG